MIIKEDINYTLAGTLLTTVIPKGTKVNLATNLPLDDGLKYWVEAWDGISFRDLNFLEGYGCLLDAHEVTNSQ